MIKWYTPIGTNAQIVATNGAAVEPEKELNAQTALKSGLEKSLAAVQNIWQK